jgi:2-polyprenyl-6-hydroxyphenyl methylase/3-demethylubiquinone-9 3-methyltransferase
MFGPYEHQLAQAYRQLFVDLDELAVIMRTWVPQADNILEVGCGEGAMTERIRHSYSAANVTAIDITANVGRLFRGDRSAVTFSQETVQEVAVRKPGSFDLVVLSDVIHHVPVNARQSLLDGIHQAMTPNGSLIFKDWIISATPIHLLCTISDRYVTGDDVTFCTMDGISKMLTRTFGSDAIRLVDTVRPWRNNVAVLVRQ